VLIVECPGPASPTACDRRGLVFATHTLAANDTSRVQSTLKKIPLVKDASTLAGYLPEESGGASPPLYSDISYPGER